MYISGMKNRVSTVLMKLYYKICYGKNITIGKKTHFRKSFIINIRGSGKVNIGENCFFNNYCSITSIKNVNIGNDCIFGEGVKIYDNNHRFRENTLIVKQGFKSKDINIGNNCWVGSNVIILKGANIGDNVVIGAGCIIDQPIQSNSIVRNNMQLKIEKIDRSQ